MQADSLGLAAPAVGSVLADHELTLAPADRDELLQLYRDMLLVRRFEERVGEMYTRAKIGGYTHLNIGEEATIAGAVSVLRGSDYVFAGYRAHGPALLKGIEPGVVMAELFGKETGAARGRGGSMHLYDAGRRFMGGYAIVGGWLPLATGVGLAIQYRGAGDVVMCLFGEGGTNIGGFHEAMNLAAVWHLPVVFLCVNNQYAMGATVGADSAVAEIYRKAAAYDMRSERVDGMDLLAVRDLARRMVDYTRTEGRPSFIEAVCYRFRGHSMADPARYRTQDEVRAWLARDPVATFERNLTSAGLLSPEEAATIAVEVERTVDAAVEFAENSPSPDPADLRRFVYAGEEE